MKKIDSNRAFQNILKNAPEMPQPKMPDQNPKSRNGNLGLIVTLVVVIAGQLITIMAINKLRKDTLGHLRNNPVPPKMTNPPKMTEETPPIAESDNPPTDLNS